MYANVSAGETSRPLIPFVLLFSLPVVIWSQVDFASASAADTAPLLLGIPLAIWLGAPWRFHVRPLALHGGWALAAALMMAFGFAAESILVLAAGWTCLAATLVRSFVVPVSQRPIHRLLFLAFCSFPWIVVDGQAVGWCFRISGAWFAEQALSASGVAMVREGTLLYVNDLCISVGAACSGLNTLQSMLLGGAVLAYIMLAERRWFWWHVPIIIVCAWFANAIRVLLTGAIAIAWGPAYVQGAYHEWEGWCVLALMFVACSGVFSLLASWDSSSELVAETPS